MKAWRAEWHTVEVSLYIYLPNYTLYILISIVSSIEIYIYINWTYYIIYVNYNKDFWIYLYADYPFNLKLFNTIYWHLVLNLFRLYGKIYIYMENNIDNLLEYLDFI